MILLLGQALAAEPWAEALDALGPGIVPELPVADPHRLDLAIGGLSEDHGWHREALSGILALRAGEYVLAARVIGEGQRHCDGDLTCDVFLLGLGWFGLVDQHSSADRALLLSALQSRSPESVSRIDEWAETVEGLIETLPPLEEQRIRWLVAAAQARENRGLATSMGLIVPAGARADLVEGLRGRVRGADEVCEWLRWSVDTLEPPPEFSAPLARAAAVWHADALVAPAGGVAGANINPVTMPGAWSRYSAYGVQAPEAAAWNGDAQAGLAALDGSRDGRAAVVQGWAAHLGLNRRAAERAFNRAAQSLQSTSDYARLLTAAVAVAVDAKEVDEALQGLAGVIDLTEQRAAYGVQSATYATWTALIPRVTAVSGPAAGARFAREGWASAIAHQQVDRLPTIATAMLDPLGVPGFEVERILVIDEALTGAQDLLTQRTALTASLDDDDGLKAVLGSNSDVAALVCMLAIYRVDAMAHLAYPSEDIGNWNARMRDGCKLAAVPAELIATAALSAEIQRRLAGGDDAGALDAARAGRDAILSATLAAGRGDAGTLPEMDELLDLHPQTDPYPNPPRELGPLLRWAGGYQQHEARAVIKAGQAEAVQRLYLELTALLGLPARSREVFAAWRTSTFTGPLRAHVPWLEDGLSAMLAEAEGHPIEARAAYSSLLVRTHGRPGTSEAALRGRFEEGWLRTAGAAPAATLEQIEDVVDPRRWDELRLDAGTSTDEAMPALDPSWRRRLPPEGRVLGLVAAGSPRELLAWISTRDGEQARRTFTFPADALRPAWLIRQVGDGGYDATVTELARWIGRIVPPGVPVVLYVDGGMRYAGLHALDIDGGLFAVRNPISYAPTLRDFAVAAGRRPGGHGFAVVGMPLGGNDSPAAIEAVESESTLRALGADEFAWNDGATPERLAVALERRAVVHVSSHGEINRIDPRRNGLGLADGTVFGPADLAELHLPGSLVVMSACRSGYWSRSFEGVPALDLVLLRRGARAVVSTPLKADAAIAATWMRSFHEAVRAGDKPAVAAGLATRAAQAAFPNESPRDVAAFSILGDGW